MTTAVLKRFQIESISRCLSVYVWVSAWIVVRVMNLVVAKLYLVGLSGIRDDLNLSIDEIRHLVWSSVGNVVAYSRVFRSSGVCDANFTIFLRILRCIL